MIRKIILILTCWVALGCAGYKPVPEKLELALPLVAGPKLTFKFEKNAVPPTAP